MTPTPNTRTARRRCRTHTPTITRRGRPRHHPGHATLQQHHPQPTTTQPQPLAYSPTHAAALLGISRAKLYTEMTNGRIHARKLGRRTLITRDELHRYLASLPTTH